MADFLFPDVLGGSARFASELNDSLCYLSNVEVITRSRTGIYSGTEKFDRSYQVLKFGLKSFFKVFNKRNQYDLIISHHYFLGFISIFLSNKATRVYFFHGPVSAEEQARGGMKIKAFLKGFIEYIVLSKQDKIFCLSDYMASKVPVGLKHKIEVVGPLNSLVDRKVSVDLEQPFVSPKFPIKLLCVRRLTPRTGVIELVDIVSKLIDRIELTIIGKGELLEPLIKKNLANVCIISDVSESELEKYYVEADLTILPTRQLEGFGLVIIESILRGTPVLASTKAGGGKQFLEKVSSNFIYPLDSNPTEFEQSVVRCITTFSDTSCKRELIKKIKKYSMKNFALDLVASIGSGK